jgi:hypothetical protein
MKNDSRIRALLILAACLAGCSETPQLTEPTSEGKNTMSCRIDGAVWEARSYFPYQVTHADWAPGGTLRISGIDYYSDRAIELQIDTPVVVGTRSIRSAVYNRFQCGECGRIDITTFDTARKVIAGTFEFQAQNDSGQTVKITEGRFDLGFVR